MNKTANIKERYRNLKGLSSVIDRYGAGKMTLQEIADAIGYTKETVRNDIKREIGERGFKELREKKKETRRTCPELGMNISMAQQHLAEQARKADKSTKKELQVLSEVLTEIEKTGVSLCASRSRYGNLRFMLSDGTPVDIRVAVIDGQHKEHQIGIHRFKTNPQTSQREFSVFAISHADEIVTYVFAPSELGDVRSLNLRYIDESKYDMERKSKYDYARARWSILKRCVR